MAGTRTAEGGLKPEVKIKIVAGVGLAAIACGVISLLSPDANQPDGQPVPGSGDAGPTAGELTAYVPAWLEVGDSCETAPMAVFPVSGVNVGVLCDREALDHTMANVTHDVVVIDPRPVIDLHADGWQEIPGIDRLVPMIETAGVLVDSDGDVKIGVFSHTYFEGDEFKRGFGLLFPSIGLPDTLTMVDLPEGLLNDPSLCTPVETGEYRCNLPVVGYNHDVAAGLVPVEAEGVPLVVRGVILQVDEDGVLQQVDFNGKEYRFGGGHLAAPAPVFSPAIVEPLPESPTATLVPAADSEREELLTEVADARRSILEPPEPETPIPPIAVVRASPEPTPEPSLTPTPEQPMSPELQRLVAAGWPANTEVVDPGFARVEVSEPLTTIRDPNTIGIMDCRNPYDGYCHAVPQFMNVDFKTVMQAWETAKEYVVNEGKGATVLISYSGNPSSPDPGRAIAAIVVINP